MENIVNSTIALYKAYRKTRCGKRDNPTAMRYRMEAIERTVALSERLQRRDYSSGPYYPFKVYEPKERLVLAIDFEGKVVQHSLCDNVLEPAFSRRFIRDNYAGQIGKGTHDGLDRLAAAMRHYFFSRKAADEAARKTAGLPPRPMNEWDYADGWVLKGDFSKFFYTLLHSYCYETARRALKWLKDPELIDFAEWLLWLIQDGTRQRRAILRELDGPHLTRQHLPPAAEHGRLFLQLFPGAQTITERRQHPWPKN